jgi:hypothetical protein
LKSELQKPRERHEYDALEFRVYCQDEGLIFCVTPKNPETPNNKNKNSTTNNGNNNSNNLSRKSASQQLKDHNYNPKIKRLYNNLEVLSFVLVLFALFSFFSQQQTIENDNFSFHSFLIPLNAYKGYHN